MRVTAAVEPGTNTEAAPVSTPACSTTLATPAVRSTTSLSPSVENRRCPVCTGTGLEAGAAREGLPGLVEHRVQALDLVRSHRVAVVGLGIAALPDLRREGPDAGDHLA